MKKPDVHIPDEQKNALVQAILTLLTVLFGIGLTLASQAVTYYITPSQPTVLDLNGSDQLQTLGATHLTDLYVDNLDAETALTAQTATITGTLSAEQLTSTDDLSVTDDATIGGDATVTGAASLGGDLTLENDETISNSTDGLVTIGGFLALTEGTVVEATAAGTLTPLASFQPITSSAVITNAVIADGSAAGQLLILVNENAADDITILESGSNLDAGGDVTLTGGAVDAITLLWTGSTWTRLSFEDN